MLGVLGAHSVKLRKRFAALVQIPQVVFWFF